MKCDQRHYTSVSYCLVLNPQHCTAPFTRPALPAFLWPLLLICCCFVAVAIVSPATLSTTQPPPSGRTFLMGICCRANHQPTSLAFCRHIHLKSIFTALKITLFCKCNICDTKNKFAADLPIERRKQWWADWQSDN